MSKDLKRAINELELAIYNLETFIPKGETDIESIFNKAFYYIAFGIKGLELYYQELH